MQDYIVYLIIIIALVITAIRVNKIIKSKNKDKCGCCNVDCELRDLKKGGTGSGS